uniref:Putative salivary secreted protein n=1 Tax=Ixodes ricinus TaxID=34613 RepID=A0A6B0US90_IXORI
MLQRLYFTVLLVQTVRNGVFSQNTTTNPNECMKLIQKGGNIACRITGEGIYRSMSVSNCWISCNDGENNFMIPSKSCQRTLDLEFWAAYQQLTHHLPPYGYEDCDDEIQRSLERWVTNWERYEANARTNLCKHATG